MDDAACLPHAASTGATTPRPDECDRLALVLQGGGALGAYQAGVYEALHAAGLEPDWLAGVSIGGINAALIAGNRPEHRLDRLRAFWDTVTAAPIWPLELDATGDFGRKARNAWSSLRTLTQGQPGFFSLNLPGPWLSPRGGSQSTAFYDFAPLRETLLRLVDFDLLNQGGTRFAVGAVNVANGNFAYFDNADTVIGPEHIMASAALPPGLPMVAIGDEQYWDGGLVSNTPLQHLLDQLAGENALVFQVDLFSARGIVPRDMPDVLGRAKDIQYSSRTRLVTDHYMRLYGLRLRLRDLLARLPEAALTEADRALRRDLRRLPRLAILHLIYQQAAYEGDAKDYDFSAASMREHWRSGQRDTERTLLRREWLELPDPERGIVVHDVHRDHPEARP
jgi:NTE family protein